MKDKKIAIDSGIILDSNKVKQDWLYSKLGVKFELWQLNKTELEPIIGEKAYEAMRLTIFTETNILAHPITEGVDDFFDKFRDNKMYMLTVKTPNYIPYLMSWLEKHKASFPKKPHILTAHNTTKAEICRIYGIDIIIDDDIRHLREIPDSIERIFFKPELDDVGFSKHTRKLNSFRYY